MVLWGSRCLDDQTHIYIYTCMYVCIYIYVYMRIKLINDYNDCWLIVRYFSVLDHMVFNHQTMGMVIILDSRGDPVLKQFLSRRFHQEIHQFAMVNIQKPIENHHF